MSISHKSGRERKKNEQQCTGTTFHTRIRISFSRFSRPSALPFGFIPSLQVAAGAGTSSPPLGRSMACVGIQRTQRQSNGPMCPFGTTGEEIRDGSLALSSLARLGDKEGHERRGEQEEA